MTRTVAREIAIQLSFAAQLAGDDARETADTFFSREYFRSIRTRSSSTTSAV